MTQQIENNTAFSNLLLHLRIPFSVFLMPVFWFAFSRVQTSNIFDVLLIFSLLHLLVYPSSNGYNSYMDNDTESIGGIEHPPKVPKAMFWVSVSMDILALIACVFFFNFGVAGLLLGYILASRAYSYRGIRLKKYPVLGFLTVAIFQGPVIFSLVLLALNSSILGTNEWLLGIFISFLLIGAGYPLTQIYQHKQDRADDVQTLSLLLGIRGTFIFSALLFAFLGISMSLFFIFFGKGISDILLLLGCLSPVAYYFGNWMYQTFLDERNANFTKTMGMNKIGSIALNLFFILLLFKYKFFV